MAGTFRARVIDDFRTRMAVFGANVL